MARYVSRSRLARGLNRFTWGPHRLKIKATVVDDIITFELDRPCNASCICKIISDGDSFFTEAQEVNIPEPADAGTHMLTDFGVVSSSDDT
jgi:hypothetical protein